MKLPLQAASVPRAGRRAPSPPGRRPGGVYPAQTFTTCPVNNFWCFCGDGTPPYYACCAVGSTCKADVNGNCVCQEKGKGP
jgi:hypothetical protein